MKKRSSSQKSQKVTVKTKGAQERVTIRMDLGDKTSRYCRLSNEGETLREGQVATTKTGMVEAFGILREDADRHRGRYTLALGEPSVTKAGP